MRRINKHHTACDTVTRVHDPLRSQTVPFTNYSTLYQLLEHACPLAGSMVSCLYLSTLASPCETGGGPSSVVGFVYAFPLLLYIAKN